MKRNGFFYGLKRNHFVAYLFYLYNLQDPMKKLLFLGYGVLISLGLFAQEVCSPESANSATDSPFLWETVSGLSLYYFPEATDNLRQHAGTFAPVGILFDGKFLSGRVNENGVERWGIVLPGVQSAGLIFSRFFIPEGLSLYIYSPGYTDVRGPFTYQEEETPIRVIPPFTSDSLIFELNGNLSRTQALQLFLEEVLIIEQPFFGSSHKGFGDSGGCEVNVHCSEGMHWYLQQQSVVRILLRAGGQAYWCTGALVNNTRNDYKPYLLTADHCGYDATEEELNQWIFYFNYAFPDCSGGIAEPVHRTLVGCRHVASGGASGAEGSDFFLVELQQQVPFSFNPFFTGWDRTLSPAESGVTIHHPDGDVKKISTFTAPITSAQWNNSGIFSHWKVIWASTVNGHGVTEGGSSGAPLFNADGYLIGSLTGGLAACVAGEFGPGTGPDQPDYFGKFTYSWDQNGSLPAEQLAPWLDPDGIQPYRLEGLYNSDMPVASFTADTSVIIGETLDFYDRSQGNPTEWNWYFEGGNPSHTTGQNPGSITYSSYGSFDVRLVVSNAIASDTLLAAEYVKVIATVYPVPSSGRITVNLGKSFASCVDFALFDGQGRQISPLNVIQTDASAYVLNPRNLAAGTYYLKIFSESMTEVKRLVVVN